MEAARSIRCQNAHTWGPKHSSYTQGNGYAWRYSNKTTYFWVVPYFSGKAHLEPLVRSWSKISPRRNSFRCKIGGPQWTSSHIRYKISCTGIWYNSTTVLSWQFSILLSMREHNKVRFELSFQFFSIRAEEKIYSLWLSPGPNNPFEGTADPSWITFPQLWHAPGNVVR
jgi:hypothetical protein